MSLGIHPDTLRDRAADGTVRAAKVGRSWRFLESDLLDYFGRLACRSTSAQASGISTSVVDAAGALDALLGPVTEPKRKSSTTSLRLVSGNKSSRGSKSRTLSLPGSKRDQGQSPSSTCSSRSGESTRTARSRT